MRQSNNYESPTRRNGTHEAVGLDHLFKPETGGLATRHCFPIGVHVPSGIMLGHAVCGVCTEALGHACPIEVGSWSCRRAGPPINLVNESAMVSRSTQIVGPTWFQLEPTVHNVIDAGYCHSMKSSILPTSIFFDARIAAICGTLTKARTDQRVARS
jgi:hypothetical protein